MKSAFDSLNWVITGFVPILLIGTTFILAMVEPYLGLTAVAIIISYFIGAIPTGYWLAKTVKGIDIRTVGSGSTGATNVYRNVGPISGVAVFVIDFLKGYLPVIVFPVLYDLLGYRHAAYGIYNEWLKIYQDHYNLLPVLTAAASLIGHSRSIFLGFKGGKSAATGLGTLFALDWRVGLLTFLSWFIVLFVSRIVSISSILATASCIPLMTFFNPKASYITYCVLGFIYVTVRHKANIDRIIAGSEPRIGGKTT